MSMLSRTTWRIGGGCLLILLGIIGWVVPVMPGWGFIAAGVLLLAPHVRAARRAVACVRRRVPAARPVLRRFGVRRGGLRQRHAASSARPPGDSSRHGHPPRAARDEWPL